MNILLLLTFFLGSFSVFAERQLVITVNDDITYDSCFVKSYAPDIYPHKLRYELIGNSKEFGQFILESETVRYDSYDYISDIDSAVNLKLRDYATIAKVLKEEGICNKIKRSQSSKYKNEI